ncbi:hypothetical protein BDV96DRAFT_490065 [Lophiotrema nucula]|uniref:Glycoside hydrolase family 93 protein n=1 Tax=Lophiotrema nucula TaxID=690887 RepID=A0A6A5ZCD9_9PLEO|nr:hypothetical protein BDV96DRAFT_490065 [Lophiotrema nucula]
MILAVLFAALSPIGALAAIDTFANTTVYDPGDANVKVSYARTETTTNNTIIAAWSDLQANSSISIYRSADNGFSWYAFGTATSDVAGRRLVQPHLLYVNETFGDYDAGTVLLAVNAVDDKSTNIEIYASGDLGETFALVSTVATGGKANTTNGATPVWEPFLLLNNHKIICYYSDQRDPQHGQKLSHQTTSEDFDSWGSAIDDVAFQNYTDRPGMTTVAKLPNGQFILTFEYAQPKPGGSAGENTYPIYYKLSNDPENFGTAPAQRLVVDTGARPNGGPYVTWTPLGGTGGTVVVSDSDSNSIFVNTNEGAGNWTEVKTPAGRAYSREVRVPSNDNGKLRITGGAEYDQQGPSLITATVMDLSKALNITQ